MTDTLRDSYDTIPYRHGAITLSHPARLGAIARLLGLQAALPDRCRVLELGCGEGMNLLPMAERFPGSEFVGVDFSNAQIAVGSQACSAAGLGNARFVCADLRTFDPVPGGFDYVIAHGVYSWVPPEVRERLLAVCASALAPSGVVYLSYNTQPSGGILSGLRAVLLRELMDVTEPSARCARLAGLLETLARSFSVQPGPYAELMRDLLAEMRAKPVELVLHDELEEYNEPCTFIDFADNAARHGLQFLSEAHFASMPFEHLSAEARLPLTELILDPLREQQYLDLLGNRRFRASLLCRETLSHPRVVDPQTVRGCAIGTRLHLERPEVDLRPGYPMQVVGGHGVKFIVSDPVQKAFLAILIGRAPERILFAEALADAVAALAQSGISPVVDEMVLMHAVARLFSIDQVDLLLVGESDWLSPDVSAPSTLMRHQARADLAVVNLWHENVELNAVQRAQIADPIDQANLDNWRDTGLLV